MDEPHADALAARLADDLDGTFEALVRAHQDRLYGLAFRSLGDAQDAEELTQDTFVRAYRALAGYDASRRRSLAIRPWLSTIALNLIRNRVRRARPITIDIDRLTATIAEPATHDDGPEAGAVRAEDRRALVAQVAALPARYREPLLLRYVVDLAYGEMAAVLGTPEGTLRAQVHRGLALLRAAAVHADRDPVPSRPQEVLA